jgi:subtilisin family serine protease
MNRFKTAILYITASVSILMAGCSPRSATYSNIVNSKNVQALNENNVKTSSNGYENSINKVNNINDPDFNEQWAIRNTESDKAWSILNQKRQIKVAVVDTGVDYNHPDLKNRVRKDLGYNFINNTRDAMDDNWHGTHVAGIIAAEAGNKIGITGVVGETDVVIIPVKVLDKDGQGSSDIMAKGIKYAADAGADIINFSVGFKVKDKFIEDAIKYARDKGAFVVVSSGNDSSNCDFTSPASDDGAYTVGSIGKINLASVFSNFGHSVKTAAPGEDILSTIPGGEYDYRSGTSMAAPVAAGIAAMVKAENPELSPKEIEYILNKSSVDIMEKGKDDDTGYGALDAYNAIKRAENFDKTNMLVNAEQELKSFILDTFLWVKP